ncbi:MAG: HupE/UreJ family protein, partial [Vicinamibacterales bacterium]
MRTVVLGLMAILLLSALPASAHPTPFSYLDVRVSRGRADVDLVAHIIDVAHDLQVDPPEQLLDADVLRARQADIAALLGPRLRLRADDTLLMAGNWSVPEAVADRQSIRISTRFPLATRPGTIALESLMFAYDPQHQTFVNVYEDDTLALQAILDQTKTRVEFFSGSRQGVWAVVRRFVPSGIEHILIGPDHLLFLVGLLLLGGSIGQLLLVVSSFTIAH